MDQFSRRANELARMRAGLIDEDDDDESMQSYGPGQRSFDHKHPLVNEKSYQNNQSISQSDSDFEQSNDDIFGGMLKDVVEHDSSIVSPPSINQLVLGSAKQGFPRAFKRNDQSISQSVDRTIRSDPVSKPRKSLFAMQRDLEYRKSINQSPSQSISQSTNQPASQSNTQLANQPIAESIDQSVNQPTTQSVDQPAGSDTASQSHDAINQSIDISDYSLIQSINQKYKLVNEADVQSISRENEAKLKEMKRDGTLEETISEFMGNQRLIDAMAKLRAKRSISQSASQSVTQSTNQSATDASSSNQLNQSVNAHSSKESISQSDSSVNHIHRSAKDQSSTHSTKQSGNQPISRSVFDRTYGQLQSDQSVLQSINQTINQSINGEDEKSEDDHRHVHFDVHQSINQSIDQLSIEEKLEWMKPAEITPDVDWSKVDWATGLAYNYEQSINQSNQSVNQSDKQPNTQSINQSIDAPHGDAWLHWRVGFYGEALFDSANQLINQSDDPLSQPVNQSISQSDGYDGLHHHAEQPDRAGYSINELIHLSQSLFPSQQSISLLIMSRIFDRIHLDQYEPPKGSNPRIQSVDQFKQSLSQSTSQANNQSGNPSGDQSVSQSANPLKPVNFNELVLEHLFARGAVTRIRLSLDSINQSIITAALKCIDSALGPHQSINQLINQSITFNGHFTHAPVLSQHSINQSANIDSPVVHDQSINQAYINFMQSDLSKLQWNEVMSENLHDEQSINQCIICGLIQMNILPRLRYLLINQSINQSVSRIICRILAHIAFHCESSARAINSTDRLIDLLIDCSLTGDPYAMLTIAACMKADRNQSINQSVNGSLTALREFMLKANGLPGQIATISQSASQSVSQSINQYQLSTVSLIIWRISLAYSIDKFDFLSFFPVLMTGVTRTNQSVNQSTNHSENDALNQSINQQTRAMWNVFEGLCESLIEDEKPVSQSVNQSINQSTKQSVDEEDDTGVSVTHLVNAIDHALSLIPDAFNYKSISQSISQSNNQSVNQSITQSDLTSAATYAGGLVHCIATYYQTINQSIYRQVQPIELTGVQIKKHRDTFFQSINQSTLIEECLSDIQNYQSIHRSINQSISQSINEPDNQFFCFPVVQQKCEKVDLSIDCLIGVGRWLNANLTLAQSINQSINQSVKQSKESTLVSFVLKLITSLSSAYLPLPDQSLNQSSNQSTHQSITHSLTQSINQSPLSLNLALLIYEWLQVLRKLYGPAWEQSINQSIYQSACMIVPVLVQGGRLYEANQSINQLVFSPSSISWLQSRTCQHWKSEYIQSANQPINQSTKCLICDWSIKDFVGASGAHHTLSSIFQHLINQSIAPSDNQSDNQSINQSINQSKTPIEFAKSIVLSPSKRPSLSFPQSSSFLSINQSINQSNALHWLFLPLRNMNMFDSLTDNQSINQSSNQSMMVRQVRTYVQYLNWLCETEILSINQSINQLFLLLTRSVMEIYAHSSRLYDDPSISQSINHLIHLIMQSIDQWKFDSQSINQLRGWGGNYFPFFQRLIDSFSSEGFGDSNFAVLILLSINQSIHVDYRLMFWSTLQRQASVYNDVKIPIKSLNRLIDSYETNKELLSIYQSLIAGNQPIIESTSDMFLVLATHLLNHWGARSISQSINQAQREAIIKKRAINCNPNTIQTLIDFKPIRSI